MAKSRYSTISKKSTLHDTIKVKEETMNIYHGQKRKDLYKTLHTFYSTMFTRLCIIVFMLFLFELYDSWKKNENFHLIPISFHPNQSDLVRCYCIWLFGSIFFSKCYTYHIQQSMLKLPY